MTFFIFKQDHQLLGEEFITQRQRWTLQGHMEANIIGQRRESNDEDYAESSEKGNQWKDGIYVLEGKSTIPGNLLWGWETGSGK